MSLLTKHGLFKEAPTSEEADINMEPDEELSENELLSEDNENQYSNERSERDKEASDTQGERTKDNIGNTRHTGKRKRDEPVPLEQQVKQSEQAIKSLKRHLERKTCPKSLQYRARARIRADNDFRRDIKRLRSKAEQDYVEALIRFHNRRIESLRSALRKEKRFKSSKPNRKGTVNYKATVGRKTPSETVTAETAKKAEKTIEELQEIVSLYKANKEKKDYTCLLTDSHTISKRRGNTKPSRVRSKMRKTCRKKNRIDRLHTQTEANKEHIKNL